MPNYYVPKYICVCKDKVKDFYLTIDYFEMCLLLNIFPSTEIGFFFNSKFTLLSEGCLLIMSFLDPKVFLIVRLNVIVWN